MTSITYQLESLKSAAKDLADKWQYELLSPSQIEVNEPEFYLQLTQSKLQLVKNNSKSNPLFIDFNAGTYRHRRLYGGGKNQLIAKAMGMNKGYIPHVYDATAGLARDAFVLAGLGCEVTMIERTNLLAGLLDNALQNGLNNPETHTICSKMHLINQDSIVYFSKLLAEQLKPVAEHLKPEIIYLDPMYPEKNGTALVKKEMQFLQQVVGKDIDAKQLLDISIELAQYRVVVKRPKSAEYLGQLKPQLQLFEKKQRLDIYINQKLPI